MENLENKPVEPVCKDGVCSLPPVEESKPHMECDGDTCRIVAPSEPTTEAPVVNLEDLL